MKKTLSFVLMASLVLAAGIGPSMNVFAAEDSASRFFESPEKGVELFSVGRIGFGPDGLLLVSSPRDASVLAIDTGDAGPLKKLSANIEEVERRLAAGIGGARSGVQIIDMAVNPASGKIYFSLMRVQDRAAVLARINADGKVEDLGLDRLAYVRMTLPSSDQSKLKNVTDLAFVDDQIVVAGQSAEEFANKVFVFPSPFENGETARFYSAETYHVAHGKWETKAPIQSFVPYEEDGKHYIVGAFACTPIAKFPIGDFEDGEKLQGVSVVELGSGNRPRDLFIYEKLGQQWLVTNTQRFKKNMFGPSKYWGARVDVSYLGAEEDEEINEAAARRNERFPTGPEARGIEVVEELFGAVLVSQLENDEVVILRETDNEKLHHLEVAKMP